MMNNKKDHDCENCKKYSKEGCTLCWSCSYCGQFGGCDNMAGADLSKFKGTLKIEKRKYLPTISELIDRLSIVQLKEVFIPEHKTEYAQEIKDIVHDIELLSPGIGELIRAVVVVSQMNLHIWQNESAARKGIDAGNKLLLTHGLNGIRNTAKNKIQEKFGGRKDYKIDSIAAEFKDWNISW